VLAARDPRQNVALLLVQVGRDQGEDRRAHHLGRGIAEDPLRGGVPGQEGAVELLADDRLVGRLDDGGEPGGGERRLFRAGKFGIEWRQGGSPLA
jgi:hypothetical protein